MSLARKISFLLMTPAFTVLALGLFLSPETARAARLTGEETSVQAVASQPQGTPPQEPTGREEIPEKAGTAQPAALAPSRDLGSTPPDGDPASKPRQTQKTAPPPASAVQEKQYVTIDFDDVDIRVFIKFVSEVTGRNFLLDERVKGKVTIISPRKIAVDEVYNVLESILEIYGFTTVEAGEVIKVVPSVEARGKNMELRLKREAMSPDDKVVTQILSLQHANPDEMKKILDPMISKTSVILSYPPTGMLIITDVLSNIKRLQEIVTALDVEGAGDEISYIPLQAASAAEIVKALTVVFAPLRAGLRGDSAGGGRAGPTR